MCVEQTSYRCVTGKIWKDSKYCRKNKSAGVRKIFLLLTLMTSPPHQKKPNKQNKKKTTQQQEREKEECKLQEKHHYETHKWWMPFDTACKDRIPQTKFYQSTHIEGNNENLGNHRDHLESTKFSPGQVRVKNSSLGQKLCKFYLHTYH